MFFAQVLAAGVGVEVTEESDFLRVIESEADDLTIIFYQQGREVARSEGIGAGYFERFGGQGFDRVRVTSTAGGLVRFALRKGAQVGYDRPVGSVGISGVVDVSVGNFPAPAATGGAFAQAAATVTNASGQLRAANAARRYLLVQNNDLSGTIFVTVDGSAATAAHGIKIGPGGSIELQGYAPTGAVFAIGSIANNANIVTVEG